VVCWPRGGHRWRALRCAGSNGTHSPEIPGAPATLSGPAIGLSQAPVVGQFDCGGRAGWKIDGQRRILAGWLRSLAPNYLRLPLLSAVPHHGSGASTSALRFLFLGLRAPIQVLDSPGMMPCFRYSHQSRAGKNDPQTPRGPIEGAGRYKRIVARTITPATPQITTIANRKCMAKHPLYHQKTTATATATTKPHMRPIAITVCKAKPILD
jgi:hypothetical protein